MPFLQAHEQPQFLPETAVKLSSVTANIHSLKTPNPGFHPKTGCRFWEACFNSALAHFRRKNTGAFAVITPTHAHSLSWNLRNQGFQICAAARAGLLLGELALVNWSSCQLVVLQCRSSQKSTSNFSERAEPQIQNFRAIIPVQIREQSPRGTICNLKQSLRSAICGTVVATQSGSRQSCLLFTPALNR